MHAFPRLAAGIALAATLALQTLPARAAFSYLSPSQTQAYNCQSTKDAGQYATSLPLCLAAAESFRRIGDAEKRNPWYSYEIEGKMLEAAAIDYSGLKRHQEALSTALQAHHLLLYVYHNYSMDPDDYADISAITARLAAFEATERNKQ